MKYWGSYSYQFNQPGVYHYWSGYVDSNQAVTLRGVVYVSDEIDEKYLEIDVSVNGISGIIHIIIMIENITSTLSK